MAFTTRERESVGTYEDLHASASKFVGLDDFGEPIYEEGLRILLDDYANLSELTPEFLTHLEPEPVHREQRGDARLACQRPHHLVEQVALLKRGRW